MKKLIIAFCAAFFACVGFAEGESINLTADIRTKQAAGLCSAPDITGSSYYGNCTYANAFDGVTTGAGDNRWLSANNALVDTAWAQYVAPSDYASDAKFALTSYKVYRMMSAKYDTPRAPTKWEILGVLPDGTTEVVATQEWTWGSSDSDADRIQTFQKLTANKYRGFQFHPLTSSSTADVKFGLLEVEFFVTISTEEPSELTIASSLPGVVGLNPAAGELVVTNATCTAPAEVLVEGLSYACGYTLEKFEDGVWTGGSTTNAGNSYIYSTANKGSYRLTWCYKMNCYNLVPQMRAEGFEPTFAGTQYQDSTPPSNAFDGEKYDSSPSKRWLCELSKKPYVQASVGSAYHSKVYLMPVGYRLWRLNTENQGLARSPKSWTFVGILSDGTEVTLDTVTGYTAWGEGNTDADRLRVFSLSDVPDGDYRGFKFVPTAVKDASNQYVGILELEIFVKEVSAGGNSLTVTSSSAYDFECSPAVGTDLTEATTCTRTSKGYLGTSRYAKSGYKLYQLDGTEWKVIETNPTADTYTWDGTGGTLKLEWQWGAADGYTLNVTSYGQETFNYSVSPDARGFYDAGVVTITPVGQTDPVSTFKEWVGDVPEESKTVSPLALTLDGPKTIRGEFTRHWKFDTETSEFTDGNWRFVAATDTTTPVGAYTPDLQLANASYQAGRGLLDMTTLPNDTKRCITTIKNGAMSSDGKAAITGLILPEGLAHIEEGVFNSCANLAFVEMSDSVLWCGNIIDNNGAFGSCTALKRVKLSNGIEFLGHQTFASCTALTNVVPFLPTSLKILGSAFQGCSVLEGTPNLSSVTSMVNGCFADCTKVVGDLDLEGIAIRTSGTGAFQYSGITSAKNVEVLPEKVFYNCKSISNIACAAGITLIGTRAICGCASLRNISAADDFAKVERLNDFAISVCTDVTMPENWPSVTSLQYEVFYGVVFNPALKLTFPAVSEFGESGPFRIGKVPYVDFRGSTFTTLPKNSFLEAGDCDTEVILPETLTTLGGRVFESWNSGKSYTIRFCGDLPTTINASAFASTDNYKKFCIYIPEDKLASWTASKDFVALDDIEDVESKPGWADISKKHLIGTWRNKWCYTWSPNPCFTIIIR